MTKVADSILTLLKNNRIIEISKTENGEFEIFEKCDEWFGTTISKEQLKQLAQEIIALADS